MYGEKLQSSRALRSRLSCMGPSKGPDRTNRARTAVWGLSSICWLQPSAYVNMSVKRGCLTKVGGSGNEEERGTAGNAKWMKQENPQWLAGCYVNVATSSHHFTADDTKNVAPWKAVVDKRNPPLPTKNIRYSTTFYSLYFFVFCQITVILRSWICGTLCVMVCEIHSKPTRDKDSGF
jgi:hypothetical protein